MDSPAAHTALSPRVYVTANLLVTLGSLYLMSRYGLREAYFFLPVLALGISYGLLYFIRQCRDSRSRFSIDRSARVETLLRRALARYLVWLVVLALGYQLYLLTPPYSNAAYRETHLLFEAFLHGYLWLGLPYFAITLIFKASRTEDFYDPAIRFIHVFKQIILRSLRGDSRASVFRVLRKPYNRKVFLNLVMRAYFVPVMVEQIMPTASATLTLFYQTINDHQFMALIMLFSAGLWLFDVLNASAAYCLESRWLENRSRSIDLTFGGWAVCLSCYAPLNNLTSSVFAFAPFIATNQPDDMLINNLNFFYALKIAELLFLVTHIYVDTSLGPSVANITLKKLQTRGPYALIRHPGTTTKLLFWLLQSVFYKKFWTAKYLLGYLGWSTIYVLRALTEERHLKKFAEYRQYMKEVKHRFFPGLF
ncbi:MAG TPA: hypothetical protein ENI97_11390 [Gammaproteobacteria bacterium]|nr:hypothetical protein [Gammaproteobacteria bacterium]